MSGLDRSDYPLEATTPATTQPQDIATSAWVQRLDRRRTHPVGVVDLRQFRTRFTGISQAIARRLEFLNRLQMRYGITDQENAQQVGLILVEPFSQQLPDDHLDTFSTVAQSIATLKEHNVPDLPLLKDSTDLTSPAPTNSTPDDFYHASPAGTFRVSRQGMPRISNPDFTGSEEQKNRGDREDRRNGGDRGDGGAEFISTLQESQPSQIYASGRSSPSLFFHSSSQSIRSNSNSSNSQSMPLQQQVIRSSQITNSADLSTVVEPTIESSSVLPMIQGSSTLLLRSPPQQLPQKHTMLRAIAIPSQRQSSHPLLNTTPIQRELSQPAASTTPDPLRQRLNTQSLTGVGDPVIVSGEIPAETVFSSPPSMILQKTTTGNTVSDALASMNEKQIPSNLHSVNSLFNNNSFDRNWNPTGKSALQAAPNLSNDGERSPSNQPHEFPKQSVNIPQIAEQVSRIIARQLIVERERRGGDR
ncbi:MAG: hypothetical protein HC769_02635 [Cyanobacteria bacterium CRU_2_1]|nr:hypothetical protein [Cyanobacteria bacterium CRU_2_1]